MLAYRRFDRGFIERLGLLAGRLVAATHPHDHATDASQARALDHALIEADEDRADRAEAVLDHRVGGKRRRYRHERDVLAA